jgi:hypothetical protein
LLIQLKKVMLLPIKKYISQDNSSKFNSQ